MRNKISLPFKVTDIEPQLRIEDDIRDLEEAFDSLCDFLSGEGDFKLKGVTAVSKDDGYITWLEKVITQLPDIGQSLGSEPVFNDCVKQITYWLEKLGVFLKIRDRGLARKILSLLKEYNLSNQKD